MQQLAGTKKRRKETGSFDAFPLVNGIIMFIIVVITLYPVLNTLAISLNDGTDALRGGIYLWPRKFTWKNYITVLQKDNLITGAYGHGSKNRDRNCAGTGCKRDSGVCCQQKKISV